MWKGREEQKLEVKWKNVETNQEPNFVFQI